MPRYVEWIEAGVLNPRPDIKVTAETAASVLIDADRAAGASFKLDRALPRPGPGSRW